MNKKLALSTCALAALTLLAACGGSDDDDGDNSSAAGWQTDAAGHVTLQFAAYNGNTAIDCNSQLTLGTQQRAVKMWDFRFYISNVNLLKEDGTKVRLTLANPADDNNYDDGTHAVSLLDFEVEGTGLCDGSVPTNTTITGTVTPGRYVGAEMTLGVPFELNHLDATATTTPAVLQSAVHPGMAWNWRGGRKFTNIEFDQDSSVDTTQWDSVAEGKLGYVLLHLGSTGCVGDPANGTPISSCTASNRVPVTLDSFDPSTQVVAFDAGALFNYDIASATEGDRGCMSSATDPACAKPFEALALDWKVDGTGTGLPLDGQSQVVLKAMSR
ncbi:MbnP family copper-binding protein [Ottowia sp.]|uniref:MbnP family copper-binding protein n=1 Tax=Ottowia sp. TaxID=1898956 RepID=UPI003A884284